MYKWAVRWMIRRNLAALGRGDPAPLLAGYAPDAVLVFPGVSSWSGEHRGKPAIEAFLRRFLEAGISGEPHDILVNGPPWRTTVALVFTDRALDAAGEVVYENRVMVLSRVVWGKVVSHEDFLDTQKVEALDRHLARQQPGVS
jgi:ketosteroid isomerase-like protein